MNTPSAGGTRTLVPYEIDERSLRDIAKNAARRRQHVFVWLGGSIALSLYVEWALRSSPRAPTQVAIAALLLLLIGGVFAAARARWLFRAASIEARTSEATLAERLPLVVGPSLFEPRDEEPFYLQGRSEI